MEGKLLGRIFLGIALVLSVVNMVLLVSLLETKRQLADAAGQAAGILQQFQSQTLAAPFTVTMAIDDTFNLPIKISVPIKTTVNVPITVPIIGQTVTISVPIDTVVPINTTARIPIKTSVPVRIDTGDSPLGTVLQQIQDWLKTIAGTN